MFRFERLAVWRKSLDLVDLVYDATESFPPHERFGLTNQLRRAAVSIASNLSEGSARSDADFCKFIGYASGSLYEVVTQSFLARRRRFLSEEARARIFAEAEEISRMLSGLRDSLR